MGLGAFSMPNCRTADVTTHPQKKMNKCTTYWPGTNVVKSTGNAFTVRPEFVFSNDKAEMAKATLESKSKKTTPSARQLVTVAPRTYGAIPNALRSMKG